MYAHQHTKEPGSAFYGALRHGARRPRCQPALSHGQFRRAEQHLRARTTTTAIAVRYGYNQFDDIGGNFPEFDAATLGFPSSLVDAMTFNTFPNVEHHRLQRRLATTVRTRRRTSRRPPTRRCRKLAGHHTLKFGGEYRRIGADVVKLQQRPPAPTRSRRRLQQATPTPQLGAATPSPVSCSAFRRAGAIVYATPAEYVVDYYAGFAQDEYRGWQR